MLPSYLNYFTTYVAISEDDDETVLMIKELLDTRIRFVVCVSATGFGVVTKRSGLISCCSHFYTGRENKMAVTVQLNIIINPLALLVCVNIAS